MYNDQYVLHCITECYLETYTCIHAVSPLNLHFQLTNSTCIPTSVYFAFNSFKIHLYKCVALFKSFPFNHELEIPDIKRNEIKRNQPRALICWFTRVICMRASPKKNHFQYCLLPLLVENNEIKENRGINFYFLCNNA